MKDYRTQEQWEEMTENMANGNWNIAAQNAVDYAFYASDMINKIENDELMYVATDFITLAEMAQELR